jgi:hypothetical protein
MSNRLDQDERLATAIVHIIEALHQTPDEEGRKAAREHLALAEKHALNVLNHGKDQWHPDYRKPTMTTEATE